jgi:hypothetical protein
MARRALVAVGIAIILIGLGANSVTARDSAPADRTQASSLESVDNTTFINANNILMFVTNYGSFGRDLAGYFGNDYGTYFPFSTEEAITSGADVRSPLYAGGLWIGGVVESETRVTVSEYASEYVPGPMAGGTFQTDRPEFKVYKIYSDSTETNPNGDWLNWPTGQGAPLDDFGNPRLLGDQTLWTVYNDADPLSHDVNSGGTSPLGIEVQQTVCAYDNSAAFSNTVIVEYQLHNRGSNTINDCYLGIWLDPDLGGSSDDLVGCDSTGNLFFCYNADNSDLQYGSTPPAIGAKILHGPLVPSISDTAIFNGHLIFNYRNLELEAFGAYIGGVDPANAVESYNVMRGLHQNGTPNANGTSYFYPGDPVAGTGDLDVNLTDKKMIGGLGPFTFAPGDSQYVSFALIVGQGADRLSSVTTLKDYAAALTQTPTDVDDDPVSILPGTFILHQNYPNPFNPGTDIGYELRVRAEVKIDIFNVLGQRVKSLLSESQPAGEYSVHWDGKDEVGREAASGIYFYRASFGHEVQSRKMVLMK